MTTERLGVVLVHRDRPDTVAATVAAFAGQDVETDIVVVDNSEDPAVTATLRRLLPADVTVLRTGANTGFGPGANVGLRHWLAQGRGEWVAVAPHDALPAEGCLARLLAEAAARADAGLVCAEFGDGFDLVPALDWVIGGFYRPATRGDGWEDVDYPHGTLMLARRAALEEIGLFDERYFAYCEEVDLALRARAAGWRVGMVWGAVVTNGTLPAQLIADYLQIRNTLLLISTRFGRYPTAVRAVLAVFSALGRARRDPGRAALHLRLESRAVADFFRGRFGPPPPDVVAMCAGQSS
ncbi:glycosyltransferase [Acidiferrimicrobium sp. IK]|uniref:glycosyltransferase family 2 protein n=1 Tax=Acidiferrimicrobium sp. IK TaxID=2871700 RepID=UPI0021CB86A7|nr:glycosyltransferase [Acidiferrimicrobium sp. IK]MCU4183816.1 glycosyltransferase [Acidiferrimicrobium sp. IK]